MANFGVVDLIVFLAANIYNLLMIVVFLARVRGRKRIEQSAGLVTVLMGFPFALAAALNAIGHRDAWLVILPIPIFLHCVIELFVDYIWKSDFRQTRWLWPYLILFYIGQWFLVGYAFLVNDLYGFVTLVTYFLCLAATAYSYSKVKHG
jgi:Ca2+/Na+ antiporter